MNVFFISLAAGHLSRDVIRADNQGAAEAFLRPGETAATEIAAKAATQMAVTELRGRHEDALCRWLTGNTNILADSMD
jgi:hypothetical protein